MNKKASFMDVLWIGIVVLILGVVTLVSFKVMGEFNDAIQDNSNFDSRGKTAMQNINNMYPGVVDNGFLIITVGLAIVALIVAVALVRIHPIFMVFYFILLAIFIFLCGIFSNIYQEIAEQPEMVAYANQLVMTSNILEYLPFIIGIFGSILAIVMYKLWSVSQE